MTQSPLITIGLTAYNGEDTIKSAVLSALYQTWDNTEIIIIDDVSTDNTAEILATLKKESPKIQIIQSEENQGVAASRNKIIEHAKGDYIAFFDDDDVSHPERLQKQYNRLVAYQADYAQGNAVICYTARTQRYPDGTERYEPTIGTNEGIAPNGKEVALRILTGKPAPYLFGSMATCSQMASTKTYRYLKFDENFRRSEDTDFNIRAAMANSHFIGLSAPLVNQTMTMASDKNLIDEEKYAYLLLSNHKDILKNNYSFYKKWLEAKYNFLKGKKFKFTYQMIILCLKNPLLTLKKILWALPNIRFNLKNKKFHHDAK